MTVPGRPAPTGLPIEDVVPELTAALTAAGHAVLVAPPGTGKTTVIPLRLLAAPWSSGRIVVLEPRRLATRAAARRMAALLGEEVGDTVGYVTRGDRRTGPATRIEVVTEGVLTRRLQRDPTLPETSMVIFDEFHERNLQTDLGLALLLDVRGSIRPDLRLLVMSATVDADRIAALIGEDGLPVPVVIAGTPGHPVEVRWSPTLARNRHAIEAHTAQVIAATMAADSGDVLAFLPGMREIRRTAELLAERRIDADVLLLHGSLPAEAQDAALRVSPHGHRRIVLSTDIAESSLTVDGIRIVIDSGLARAPRLDLRTGMTRLRTIPISKASAEQRAGRAGRLGPGVAVRLWSKMEHAGRRRHIAPEIGEVDLAGLALELIAWGEPDPAALRFLDPPPARTFEEAGRLLASLGAVDTGGALTPTGRRMVDLPLHPRLARMVVDAGMDQALACLLAALLEERDLLRGAPDDLPADLAVRLGLLLDPSARHPRANGGSIARTRNAAADLALRAEVPPLPVDPDRAGTTLALAYPDRLAIRRGGPGRFQLRTGTTAWMAPGDPLAAEDFLIAPDLDGKRRDARIRLAAAIARSDVAELFAADLTVRTELVWDGDRLIERSQRRLGGIVLDVIEGRPAASPEVSAAIAARIRRNGLGTIPWTRSAIELRHRVGFLRTVQGERWPDWSEAELLASIDDWLLGGLPDVSGLDDLARVDLATLLRRRIAYPQAGDLDRLAPTHIAVRDGRRVAVDYSSFPPSVAVRVQAVFGMTATPEVAGIPVVLHLLSPADRPVQVTQDLAGFWDGSWHQVRKEMAGRYPKHDWPEDPRRPPAN